MYRIATIFGSILLVLAIILVSGWIHIAGRLKNEILNNNLEGKICGLQARFGSSRIVIAGDSRAHFQLMPAIFEKETGNRTVNLSVNAGDPISFVSALGKHPEVIAKAKLIIISIGIYQINDGAVDYGFLSLASFVDLSILDHFRLFRRRPAGLMQMYREAFRIYRMREWKDMRFACDDYWVAGYDMYSTKGFFSNARVWNRDVGKDPLLVNSWFMDLRLEGARWRQFQETMEKLERLGITVVAYQSPYSATWMLDPVTAGAVAAERDFGHQLKDLGQRFHNVHFLDFFASDNRDLPDSLFYDASHLNAKGAEVFSRMFIRALEEKKLLPDSTAG